MALASASNIIKNSIEITSVFDRTTGQNGLEHVNYTLITNPVPFLEIASYKDTEDQEILTSNLILPIDQVKILKNILNHPQETTILKDFLNHPDVSKYTNE